MNSVAVNSMYITKTLYDRIIYIHVSISATEYN